MQEIMFRTHTHTQIYCNCPSVNVLKIDWFYKSFVKLFREFLQKQLWKQYHTVRFIELQKL